MPFLELHQTATFHRLQSAQQIRFGPAGFIGELLQRVRMCLCDQFDQRPVIGESSLAKLSSDVNQIFGSPRLGLCLPFAIAIVLSPYCSNVAIPILNVFMASSLLSQERKHRFPEICQERASVRVFIVLHRLETVSR